MNNTIRKEIQAKKREEKGRIVALALFLVLAFLFLIPTLSFSQTTTDFANTDSPASTPRPAAEDTFVSPDELLQSLSVENSCFFVSANVKENCFTVNVAGDYTFTLKPPVDLSDLTKTQKLKYCWTVRDPDYGWVAGAFAVYKNRHGEYDPSQNNYPINPDYFVASFNRYGVRDAWYPVAEPWYSTGYPGDAGMDIAIEASRDWSITIPGLVVGDYLLFSPMDGTLGDNSGGATFEVTGPKINYIFLDPGHGGEKPGAGPSIYGDYEKNLTQQISQKLSIRNRGVKLDTQSAPRELYVLRHTKMPAALVETAFITGDAYILHYNRTEIAQALYEGIKMFFEQ